MVEQILREDSNFKKVENLYHQVDFQKNAFEPAYVDIRKKEGRLFTNSEVEKLPEISASHPLYPEWKIRKRSTKRLVNYLQHHASPTILEVGCGNGWLAHNLSRIHHSEVIGLDVNLTELEQASSVFNKRANLKFVLGDLFTIRLSSLFDFVIFASSAQYFANIENLISVSLDFLKPNGEIHIVDTPFYNSEKVNEAKNRSLTYFSSQDSKMHDYYFHHTWQNLSKFNTALLYDPTSPFSRLRNKISSDSPFPWIRIKKTDNG